MQRQEKERIKFLQDTHSKVLKNKVGASHYKIFTSGSSSIQKKKSLMNVWFQLSLGQDMCYLSFE